MSETKTKIINFLKRRDYNEVLTGLNCPASARQNCTDWGGTANWTRTTLRGPTTSSVSFLLFFLLLLFSFIKRARKNSHLFGLNAGSGEQFYNYPISKLSNITVCVHACMSVFIEINPHFSYDDYSLVVWINSLEYLFLIKDVIKRIESIGKKCLLI